MLKRGIIICCNIFLWNFPFFGPVVEVDFFSPPTFLFLQLCLLQVSSNPMALKIITGERVQHVRHAAAALLCRSLLLCFPAGWDMLDSSRGMPHWLFLEMAHWVHCATISTHCCALHFFPCMVMKFLRCLPFSWRGRRISLIFLTTCRAAPRNLWSCVFCTWSEGNSPTFGH